jgi:hypothetical protein
MLRTVLLGQLTWGFEKVSAVPAGVDLVRLSFFPYFCTPQMAA